MAYDYIRAVVNNKYIKQIRDNQLLDFETKVNDNGEIVEEKGKYKGLTFTIRFNRMILTGSLHYFYNNNKQNYDDFTFDKLLFALNQIELLFGVSLSEYTLENVEVGVNVRLPFKTEFVLRNILFHRTQIFKDMAVNRGRGNYRVVFHDRYEIKVYDKGLQFELPYELLRFEIHHSKMTDIEEFGLQNLSDLKDISVLEKLTAQFIKIFDECFLYDWTISELMIKRKPKGFYDWKTPYYWIEGIDKNNRYKRKKAYKNCIAKYSNKVKAQIRSLILEKSNLLISQKGDLFTVEKNIKRLLSHN